MKIYETNADGYVFQRDDGNVIVLSYEDVREIRFLLQMEQLKEDVEYIVDDYDGDYISLGSLDMTPDEFKAEVVSFFEDGIRYDGGYPTESYIKEVILDTANDYGICID